MVYFVWVCFWWFVCLRFLCFVFGVCLQSFVCLFVCFVVLLVLLVLCLFVCCLLMCGLVEFLFIWLFYCVLVRVFVFLVFVSHVCCFGEGCFVWCVVLFVCGCVLGGFVSVVRSFFVCLCVGHRFPLPAQREHWLSSSCVTCPVGVGVGDSVDMTLGIVFLFLIVLVLVALFCLCPCLCLSLCVMCLFDVVFLVFILIRLVVVCLWCCFMFDVVFVVFVWCVVLFVCLCYSSFVVVIDICLFLDCVFTLVLFVLCCRLLLFVFLFGGCDFSEGLRQWQTTKTHKKGFWFRGTPGNLEKPSKGKEHFDLFLFFGGGCFLVVVFCSFLLFFVFVSLSCFLFVFSTF